VTTPHPWIVRTFRASGLFFLLFLTALTFWNWFAGSTTTWATGARKGGDLTQHWAAAHFVATGDWNRLYSGYHLGEWINEWHENQGLGPDTGGRLERFNYVYSPFIAWISTFFLGGSFFPLLTAWTLACVAFHLAALYLLQRDTSPSLSRPEWWMFALGFPSFFYILIPAQNTTLTLLIVAAAGAAWQRGRFAGAGLILSCAFYKPQLMPFLFLGILLTGRYRAAAGLVAGNLIWLGLGLLICGFEPHLLWLRNLTTMGDGGQFVLHGLNQSWTGFFLSLAPPEADRPLQLAGFVLGTALLSWTAWQLRRTDAALYGILAAWLLASPYTGHYELLLALPLWIRASQGFTTPSFSTLLLPWIAFFSIMGLVYKISWTAPILTLWLVASTLRLRRTT
jgi:hypothetical protein